MKRVLLLILILVIQTSSVFATLIYSEGKYFGLKDESGKMITEAEYTKLIRLGDSAYIICKGGKYGIMSSSGEILVKPKYSYADRFFDKLRIFCFYQWLGSIWCCVWIGICDNAGFRKQFYSFYAQKENGKSK